MTVINLEKFKFKTLVLYFFSIFKTLNFFFKKIIIFFKLNIDFNYRFKVNFNDRYYLSTDFILLAHKQKDLIFLKKFLNKLKKTVFIQDFILENYFLKFNLNLNYFFLNAIFLNKIFTFKDFFLKKKILLEYGSINPTGFIHAGHIRNLLIGNSLANFFLFLEYEIETEFLINDMGNQVIEFKKQQSTNEENKYCSINFQQYFKKVVLSLNLRSFDVYILESFLRKNSFNFIYKLLKIKKLIYSKKQNNKEAIFVKTSNYGDVRDRVIIKENKSFTYFFTDILYIYYKIKKKFDIIITIFGFDHQEYLKGLQSIFYFFQKEVFKKKIEHFEVLFQIVFKEKNQKLSKRNKKVDVLIEKFFTKKESELEYRNSLKLFFLRYSLKKGIILSNFSVFFNNLKILKFKTKKNKKIEVFLLDLVLRIITIEKTLNIGLLIYSYEVFLKYYNSIKKELFKEISLFFQKIIGLEI